LSIYDFSQDVRGRRPRQSRLLVDDDFSWSDVPRQRGRVAVTDVKSDRYDERAYGSDERGYVPRGESEYNRAYDGRVTYGERGADPQLGGRYEFDFEDAGFEAEDRRVSDQVFLDEQSGALELAAPGRRTIVITGHGAERNLPVRRRREASLRIHERSGFRPDRIALWAFLLGLALLLGATTSSHAAVLHLAH
jgi:hypothetical protein